jgi:(p)ppGpp synthase/HD superfamily hydrolase
MEQEHPFIKDAYLFAQEKHFGKKRQYINLPYFTHPLGVYFNVYSFTNNIDIRVAALLHDTVEKGGTSIPEIARNFNPEIANLVAEVTNDAYQIQAHGKANYLVDKINKISAEALIIKFADFMDNIDGLRKLNLKDKEQAEYAKEYVTMTIYILSNIKRELTTEHEIMIKKIGEMIDQYIGLRNAVEEEKNKGTAP